MELFGTRLIVWPIAGIVHTPRPRSLVGIAWVALAATWASALPAHADSTESKKTKTGAVTAQAFIDSKTLIPGQTHELAVLLKTDANWHVYWANPGGTTGLPTEITWKSSPPLAFGHTRYPPAEAKFDKVLKETSFILPAESVLLTRVRVPKELVGEKATLAADVRWLACRDGQCVPGSATLSLEVPIGRPGAAPSPAHQALFKQAREALPVPIDKAEHVTLSVRTDGPARPGGKLTGILTAEIKPGHHMQSHTPNQDFLIPAYVFVERVEGFDIGDVAYPKAHERNDPILGKLSEYEGRVEFRIPVEIAKEDDDGKPQTSAPRRIRGVLQYQICSNRGTCFPPMHVAFEIPVQMEGGPAPGPDDEFRVAAADTSATPAAAASGAPRASDSNAAGEQAADADAASSLPGASPARSAAPSGATAPPAPDAPASGKRSGWADRLAAFETRLKSLGYPGVLVLAFLGGLVLNLMPCVLPVISLKVLSFVRQAEEDRRRILVLGLSYCAGLLTFFIVLAALYVFSHQSWGQHFQSPYVTLGLAAIVTALSLSLFGVFTIFPPRVVNTLGQRAQGEGPASAFMTGMLATVLGSACTAPGMGAALGVAKEYPSILGGFIFVMVGVGMASPFILLSFVPAWVRFVPKPGNWMHTFEVVMGFLLLGTVVWLLYPISGQLGEWGLLMALVFLLAVSLAMWIKGRAGFGDSAARRMAFNLAALAVIAIGWYVPFGLVSPIGALQARQQALRQKLAEADLALLAQRANGHDFVPPPPAWKDDQIPWLHYSEKLVELYVNAGYTVFVDFTADWCASCKTNLKTSIDVDATRKLMQELNVVPVEADYTNRDAAIRAALQRFDRDGVPLYLVFSPRNLAQPRILPEFLTPGIVEQALREAGPSRPSAATLARQTDHGT